MKTQKSPFISETDNAGNKIQRKTFDVSGGILTGAVIDFYF